MRPIKRNTTKPPGVRTCSILQVHRVSPLQARCDLASRPSRHLALLQPVNVELALREQPRSIHLCERVEIQPESLGQITSDTPTGTLVVPTSGELTRAVVQLFVAARHDDWKRRCAAEARLRQVVRELLASPVDDGSERARGGLPPIIVRRVEQLIAEAMNRSDSASPNLTELAATARVSINHFIRAFRSAGEGTGGLPQPRGVCLPAPDGARESDGCSSTLDGLDVHHRCSLLQERNGPFSMEFD
jgi:hypothetical protein